MYTATALGLMACVLGAMAVNWMWRDVIVQRLRDRLFERRDELFQLVVDGHVSVEDPAYRAMREEINHRIRSAGAMSTSIVLASLIIYMLHGTAPEAALVYHPPEEAPERVKLLDKAVEQDFAMYLALALPGLTAGMVVVVAIHLLLKGGLGRHSSGPVNVAHVELENAVMRVESVGRTFPDRAPAF